MQGLLWGTTHPHFARQGGASLPVPTNMEARSSFFTLNFCPGVTKGTALFIDGRLALMEFVYRDYALDWDSTVKNTAAKYGEPRRVVEKASWTDGETGLVLK